MNKVGIYKDNDNESIAAVFYHGRNVTLYSYMGYDANIDSIAGVISDGLDSDSLISMDTNEFNDKKELLFYVDSND